MTKYHLDINSDTRNLAAISDFVTAAAAELGIDPKTSFAIQMAVDEACSNVMEHAYCGRNDGTVSIACEARGGELIVTIRDRGRSFDPEAIQRPDPNAPLEEREATALGLFLMEKLMDSVEFHFDPVEGNTLTMRKKVQCGHQSVASET